MSEKTVAAKLGLKGGGRLWVSDPAGAALVGPLPEGASLQSTAADADVALVVVASAAEARAAVAAHRDVLAGRPSFWVAYPKGGRADINRDSLWPILAEAGIRPNTQIALDDAWSALRFRPLAPGEAPFTGGR